jgi:hypothetical protein
MQASQQLPQEAASPANGGSPLHDLFALTDEQILEIEPEAQAGTVARDPWPVTREEKPNGQTPESIATGPNTTSNQAASEKSSIESQTTARSSSPEHGTRDTEHAVEPPAWLAAQMKDPWTGEEAKELWNGVLQARKEAADYRAAFATPEDARALKELYPGGIKEARALAERARTLDDIDRAYFGAAGTSAEQTSASRAQLAAMMLREDPAAFREMVFAGLRALEQSGAQTGSDVGSRLSATSAATESRAAETQGGLKSAPTNVAAQTQSETRTAEHDARLAAYVSFEKAANEDLERAVGATIERTLVQALPNLARDGKSPAAGAQHAAPLQARLSQAIRQDVETALKGDRQLGEQVAQILSGRRLDAETRAQVVRLIGERAQQLVPTATKRVLKDWTQTTLMAHRGKGETAEAASARREVAPANPEPRRASLPAGSAANSRQERSSDPNRGATGSRAVDYRKLSDEQILEM